MMLQNALRISRWNIPNATKYMTNDLEGFPYTFVMHLGFLIIDEDDGSVTIVKNGFNSVTGNMSAADFNEWMKKAEAFYADPIGWIKSA